MLIHYRMPNADAPMNGGLVIANQWLRLQYAAGDCRLFQIGVTHPFARWTVGSAEDVAAIVPAEEPFGQASELALEQDRGPAFGPGQALLISRHGLPQQIIRLHSSQPFALVTSRLPDAPSQEPNQRITPLQMQLDLSAAASSRTDLRVLGTGGLSLPEENAGSYAWIAVAHSSSRTGVVAGWLSCEQASGVVDITAPSTCPPHQLQLSAHSDYGSATLVSGIGETFAIGWFSDACLGLEAWASAIATVQRIVLPPEPSGYCTWYDDVHGQAGDEQSLPTLCTFAHERLKEYGFSLVQIDDEWQLGSRANGPKKNFTTHDPQGPYPSGMTAAADSIHASGFTAGLWILPFGGTWDDPFFADHQDWFVRRADDGTPYVTPWGGTSLDMTHAGARAHVHDVIARAVHTWGFTYLKLDGLYTGIATSHIYVNAAWKPDALGDARFHDQTVSNIAAFRSGLRLIRDAAGDNAFILGCCIPQNMRTYAAAFGLVDAMRIGPDNSGDWKSWLKASPGFGARHYFLNGRVWWNDPDPVYVRSSLSLDQARCIASWTALSGGLFISSDWLPALPPERLHLLTRCLPAHGGQARPLDLFAHHPPRLWTLQDETRGSRLIVGVFNWSDQTQSIPLIASELGLDPTRNHAVFDFWNATFLDDLNARMELELPATSCRILAIRPLQDHPTVLSSSRHITQGLLDVQDERWEEATATLYGRSPIIADDPLEIRIAWAISSRGWKALQATVEDNSGKSHITLDDHSAASRLRVLITAASSAFVNWKIVFAR